MSSRASEPVDVLAADDPVVAVLAARAAGDLIALRTSGTTGRPRSVLRTTASWFDSFDAVRELTRLAPDSRVWLPGPLSSTMNLFAAVLTTHTGARVVPRPEEVTHAHLTPQVLRRYLDDHGTLGGVHVTVAGDRLPEALRDRAVAAGAEVSHYFGAAELSFVAWGRHEHDLRAFPGVEIAVRDGVLWSRSPFLAEGYAGAPGAFRVDADGFGTVGDRGVLADDGTVTVLGRGDESVLTGGATVHVADVEAALRPGLAGEVVVVGLPYEPLGEVVAAVLTLRADLSRARSAAGTALTRVQQPRRWFHLPELPLTGAGKVDRSAVRGLLAEAERLPTHRGATR